MTVQENVKKSQSLAQTRRPKSREVKKVQPIHQHKKRAVLVDEWAKFLGDSMEEHWKLARGRKVGGGFMVITSVMTIRSSTLPPHAKFQSSSYKVFPRNLSHPRPLYYFLELKNSDELFAPVVLMLGVAVFSHNTVRNLHPNNKK